AARVVLGVRDGDDHRDALARARQHGHRGPPGGAHHLRARARRGRRRRGRRLPRAGRPARGRRRRRARAAVRAVAPRHRGGGAV
ncbi:MAG: hypothetical protein AVDCRST_MAG54-4051, partial [uncultured Actinomycetospora sp.]